MMAFVVVQFLDTYEVSIISQSWLLNENICKWPPYGNKFLIKRALLEDRIPEDDWYDREIFTIGVFSTYAKAKEEVDIVVQSESDGEELREPETKRHKLKAVFEESSPPSVPDIRKKEIYLDPYSPTKANFIPYSSFLSTPVQPQHVNSSSYISSASHINSNFINNVSSDSIINWPSLRSSSLERNSLLSPFPVDSISSYGNSSLKNKIHCTSERWPSIIPRNPYNPTSPKQDSSPWNKMYGSSEGWPSIIPRNPYNPISPKQDSSPRNKMYGSSEGWPPMLSRIPLNPISPNQDSSPRNKMCCCSEEKLIALEKTLKSMEVKLSSISNAVEELKEKSILNASVCKENCDINLVELPLGAFSQIKTIEEMSAFNDSLADKTLFSELVKSFGCMGGRHISKATRKILAKLVSNDLAKTMNWIGDTREKGFQQFESVIQLIVAAVRQNFKEATLLEIEDSIARWLRYSDDREGGRSKRKKKSEVDIKTDEVQAQRSINNEE